MDQLKGERLKTNRAIESIGECASRYTNAKRLASIKTSSCSEMFCVGSNDNEVSEC
jgi:hypothetical protein